MRGLQDVRNTDGFYFLLGAYYFNCNWTGHVLSLPKISTFFKKWKLLIDVVLKFKTK